MAYQDKIECPHCHQPIELDIEIENDDGYMNLYPIVKVKEEGGEQCQPEASGKVVSTSEW